MFNIGWGETLILIVAGLFILGPERLPSAAAWLGRTVRQVREYATGAREQLRSQLGPEFDELRQPLEELRGLRGFPSRRFSTRGFSAGTFGAGGFNPASGLARHLLDDLDSDAFGDVAKPNGYAVPTGRGISIPRPLQPGERAPFDPDAT
ncbi:MAG TPA: Sec-independent protein translocase protein TatB [Pseudonocardiaceae bacterium]|nr:Sec-independent protein translocase protein TatB [Pseudonocardiaceae bacterium]